MNVRWFRKLRPAWAAVGLGVLLLAGGCGSSSTTSTKANSNGSSTTSSSSTSSSSGGGSTSASKATYAVVVNAPLSGSAAFIGQLHFLPGAKAAAYDVDQHGGVLGRQLKVVLADTQDDPADGLAAINQALATANPVMVVGPSSDTATAIDPVINRAKVVDWCLCGTTQLNHMTWPYVYRPSPGDGLLGAAMGDWAYKEGYRRAAFVFMSDPGSQTLVSPSMKTFEKLGGKATINMKVVPDQSNYRSEVEKVLQTHPDVLVGEMDPQTAATFLTDLQQLNNGKLLPLVESDAGASSDFYKAVSKAIGKTAASKDISALEVAGSLNTKAYSEFLNDFHKLYPGKQTEEFNTNGYDAVIIGALAMAEAHSAKPSVWRKDIASVTAGSGPKVQTYAQGVADIKKGEKPHYVGASGQITFNKYHNSSGNFWAIRFSTSGQFKEVAELTPKELSQFLQFQ